jgi:nucleotidyltransferase substrate binding protein (TIGR01987 family)
MDRLSRRFDDAGRALRTLVRGLGVPEPSELERDGLIQRFEYMFEAVCHAAQAYLEEQEGIVARSPRSCLRALGEVGVLSEEETVLALAMAEDRNRTVHTYIEEVAVQIRSRLGSYAALMQAAVERMRAMVECMEEQPR